MHDPEWEVRRRAARPTGFGVYGPMASQPLLGLNYGLIPRIRLIVDPRERLPCCAVRSSSPIVLFLYRVRMILPVAWSSGRNAHQPWRDSYGRLSRFNV